jgi:hypothetical protein
MSRSINATVTSDVTVVTAERPTVTVSEYVTSPAAKKTAEVGAARTAIASHVRSPQSHQDGAAADGTTFDFQRRLT